MVQNNSVPADREDWISAMLDVAHAADQLILDADAGQMVARDSVEMLRRYVEKWHEVSGSYFGPAAKDLRRAPSVEDPGGEGDWQLKERDQ